MALVLNEEQVMLQEAARDFLQRRTPISHLRALRDDGSSAGYSPEAWTEMTAMGWPAIVVPESHGGLGFGYTGLGIVLQEIGRTLTPSPLIGTSMMTVSLLLRHGSEQQQATLLPAIASGGQVVGIAIEEQGQHAPHCVATTARRSGDGFVLTGTKRFVLDGRAANSFIVSARTQGAEPEKSGITLFLVPADTPGLAVARRQALDIHVLADVTLSEVALPSDAVIGTEHEGFDGVEWALDVGRIAQSAELVGVMREAFERMLAYLKDRKQFGVLIGTFQALQHRAAVLYGEIEMCRSLVLHALQQLDAGDPRLTGTALAELASRCKAKVAETAMKVCEEAIQMHGGIGMTDEFDIGFFYKRARILETLFGDRHYHLDRFARLRGY